MAGLALENVSKRYGSVVALEECTLELEPAGVHCLLGPNGSGKTTLLRILLGLERPTSGTVTGDASSVGSGFQRPSFYPSLTVRENLAVFGRFHGGIDPDWRERLVEEIRLEPALDRRAGDISGGFARKLDLALALQHRPDVVLLDEPLSGLDDVSRAKTLEFLRAYADDNAVVVSTHRLTSLAPHLDRLTIVHDGSVVLDRPRAALDVDDPDALQDDYVDLIVSRAD
jgi:ABC-type multidrug transport system ATPase subunit